MSELTDLEARLATKFTNLEQQIVAWRWYAIVTLASLAVGFLVGHFH